MRYILMNILSKVVHYKINLLPRKLKDTNRTQTAERGMIDVLNTVDPLKTEKETFIESV